MALVFGVVVGFSLGLTGGGGSVFAVPLLVYGLHVPAHQAVTVSLAAVGATALGGVLMRARSGLAEYKSGVVFGLAGLAGAPLGTVVGRQVPAPLLLGGFAVLMLLVGVRMWRQASRKPEETRVVRAVSGVAESGGPSCRRDPEGNLQFTSRCALMLGLAGVATGFLSGLFGVGGGFLIVPALLFIAALSIQRAVATSLVVIAIISAAGVVSHVAGGQSVDWHITGGFVLGGLAGMGLGSAVGRRIAGPRLQKIFASMILAVAAAMLGRLLLVG